ncbi:MAG: transglutaminase-like domain-containing protein, partial [Anaerolineae bacterium]
MSTADLIGGGSQRRDSSERSFWAGLLNKLGRHNLPVYLLLIGIAGCVAYGLSTVIRGLDLTLLWMVGATAMLVGWFLARSLRSRGWATFWAAFIGVVALFIRVGRLDRYLFQLVQGWIRYWSEALPYLWQILLDEEITVTPDPSLLLEALNELGAAINALLLRTGTWLIAIVRGSPLFDPAAAVLVWGLILWMAAVWAGWTVRRHGKVLVAVTPLGILLAGVLSYVWSGPSALLFMAGITLLLMALVSHNHRESRWERSGIDYSSDLRTDLIGGAVILTLVLMSIAAVMPSVSFDDVVDFIRELQVERDGETDDVAESLGLEKQPQPRPPGTIDRARSGGLPRRHLIGSGPDLERKVVMVIATNELEPRPEEAMVEPAPRHYWRSATYDEYLGRGWYADSTRLQNYEPGETSNVTSIQYHRPLRQEVQVIGEIADLVYVSGVLVTTDQPYEVAWRSSGDLFAATIEAKSYRADSLISTADEDMLRGAHLNYPPWITERYLQLPETVPERVLALARDLTATEPTAYDRAVAIEEYLRTTFPYTLEVPLPPSDQDVVDYFLFDLQKGYCDYYASAMTVLARAAGLPARMVI